MAKSRDIDIRQSDVSGNVTVRTPRGVHVYTDPDEVIETGRNMLNGARRGMLKVYFSGIGHVEFDNAEEQSAAAFRMMAVEPADHWQGKR